MPARTDCGARSGTTPRQDVGEDDRHGGIAFADGTVRSRAITGTDQLAIWGGDHPQLDVGRHCFQRSGKGRVARFVRVDTDVDRGIPARCGDRSAPYSTAAAALRC